MGRILAADTAEESASPGTGTAGNAGKTNETDAHSSHWIRKSDTNDPPMYDGWFGWPKNRNHLFLALGCHMLALNLSFFSIFTWFHGHLESLHSHTAPGIAPPLRYLTAMMFTPVAAFLFAKLPKHFPEIHFAAHLVGIITFVSIIISDHVWTFYIAFVVSGIVYQIVSVGIAIAVVEGFYWPTRRVIVMSYMDVFNNIAYASAMPLGGYFYDQGGITLALGVTSGITLVLAVVGFFVHKKAAFVSYGNDRDCFSLRSLMIMFTERNCVFVLFVTFMLHFLLGAHAPTDEQHIKATLEIKKVYWGLLKSIGSLAAIFTGISMKYIVRRLKMQWIMLIGFCLKFSSWLFQALMYQDISWTLMMTLQVCSEFATGQGIIFIRAPLIQILRQSVDEDRVSHHDIANVYALFLTLGVAVGIYTGNEFRLAYSAEALQWTMTALAGFLLLVKVLALISGCVEVNLKSDEPDLEPAVTQQEQSPLTPPETVDDKSLDD